jgi:hypothetical protein
MESYYYSLFFVFIIIATIIVIDPNVGKYITISFKILNLNFERFMWMIRFHPLITTNPIFQWLMMRKYMKEAKKLERELKK